MLARIFIAVLASAFLFGLVHTARSSAERKIVRDPRGDALAAWDITKVAVRNGGRKLRIRVLHRGRLRPDLRPGLATSIELDMGAPSDSVYEPDFTVALARGATKSRHLYGSQGERIRCRGLRGRARPRRRLVSFNVPQRCLGDMAGRVRIAGFTYRIRGSSYEADYIRKWSRWISRG